jgi:glucitol operon activator protein
LVVFALLSLQNILGYFFQIRQYQKILRKWLGKGILGIGQRRGLFTPGEICILVYNLKENTVITVQSMRGFSVFARFKEKQEYSGLSLQELHRLGMEADRKDMGLWRILFRYEAGTNSKRKGALIQAVEAIEKDMAKKRLDPEENLHSLTLARQSAPAVNAAPSLPSPVTSVPATETMPVPENSTNLNTNTATLSDAIAKLSSLSWRNENAGKS